jgi:imidazoleglycerol phosphate dehydratase HisB
MNNNTIIVIEGVVEIGEWNVDLRDANTHHVVEHIATTLTLGEALKKASEYIKGKPITEQRWYSVSVILQDTDNMKYE